MTPPAYRELLRVARRYSRLPDEAEDLVQEALLVAVRSGRGDLGTRATLHWLTGVIRNQAKLRARGAIRSRRREQVWMQLRPTDGARLETGDEPMLLAELPPALKAVAVLALSGHNRREIAYLLDLPDTALRQRVRALKRQLQDRGVDMPAGLPGLNLDLSYGRIRDALLPLLLRQGGTFASHDPDGHHFVVRRSS